MSPTGRPKGEYRSAQRDGPRASLALRRNQPQVCDLRRRTEPQRRSPVARAAADVYPKRFDAVQPRRDGLLQANEKRPGQELAAVRMAGELQVEADRRSR